MHLQIFLSVLAASVWMGTGCGAQRHTPKQKSIEKSLPIVVISHSSRAPVSTDAYQNTQHQFVIRWNIKEAPESFFWRPQEGGWHTTLARQASKKAGAVITKKSCAWCVSTDIQLQDIKFGDTLILTPVYGGRDVIPEAVENSPGNSIYYKLEKGDWGFVQLTAHKHEEKKLE